MESIKKYTPDHYDYYFHKAEKLLDGHANIDSWVRSLTEENILIWMSALRRVKTNDDVYFQEIAIFITILIRLFALELDISINLELKNSEIEKLVNRFDYAIKREYAARKDILGSTKRKYTLLKDIKKG